MDYAKRAAPLITYADIMLHELAPKAEIWK